MFVADEIAYILGGPNLDFDTWFEQCNMPEPRHIVPDTIIGVKKNVYDYYDKSVALWGSPSQIYMFENPEKDVIHNFVNVAGGMSSIVLRVNHAKQQRFTMSFVTV